MSEWQDISTAPKDGTVVILSNGEWVERGWWSNSMWLGSLGPGWITDDPRDVGVVHSDVTHWQPMPTPPTGEAK